MKKLALFLVLTVLLFTLCACGSADETEEPSAPQAQTVTIKASVMEVKDVYILASPVSAGSGATMLMTVYTPDSTVYTDPNGNALDRAALKQGQTIEIDYMGFPTNPYPEELNADRIQILDDIARDESGAEEQNSGLGAGSLQFNLGSYACEVTIPSDWTGIYDYRIYDDGSGIEFISANNESCGGVVFAIWAVDDENAADPQYFSLCSDTAKLMDGDLTNGVSFYLVHPYTDVEYDYENESLTAEYNTMLAGEDSVMRSFQWYGTGADAEEDDGTITFMVEGQPEKIAVTPYSLNNCTIRVPTEGWIAYDDENTDGFGPLVFTPIDNNDVSLSFYISPETGIEDMKAQFGQQEWQQWKAIPGGGESCRCSFTNGDTLMSCFLVQYGQDTVIILCQCPMEAAEGFGVRMDTIAGTLKIQ